MSEDMEKRVQQYIDVRDALKRVDERWEAERKPLLEIQEALAGRIQQFMDENSLQNLKTKSGTAYVSIKYTASLADPDVFMKFVISTGKFELLDRRANSTAVKDYVAANNELPPGCNLNGISQVGVRRPAKKVTGAVTTED